MYGTGIGTGTGTAGTAALATGMVTGSWVLLVVMSLCFGFMALTLIRNAKRRGAHQRP